jgi:outer membrane protein
MSRLVAILLLAAAPAWAANNTLDLTLSRAVQMALGKNFSIQVTKLDPKIARERELSARGAFDPQFDFSATHGENTVRSQLTRDPLTNAQSRVGIDSLTQSSAFSTGISGVTVWGLGYDVGLSSTSGSRFNDDSETELSFSLRQPLLRGAGADANLSQVRIAKNNIASSEWGVKNQVMTVITETIEVYNELHFAHENLEVAKRSRELARQLLQENIKRMQIGVMTPLDVTTAQAGVASREEAVITATRSIKDQENFLKQHITADLLPLLGTSVRIEPPPSPAFRSNVLQGVADALEFRPDYRQAKIDLQNRHITLAFEKNQKLPRLDLTASLALNGVDDSFLGSARRVTDRDGSDWSAGAIFSVPIGNRDARGRVSAAQLLITQGLVSLQRLEQDIIVRIDNARGAVVTAGQRITASAEARRLAAESLKAAEGRLAAGAAKVTPFEVLSSQEQLATAETAEIRARADFNKAVARYHLETGTTLRVHNVHLE